MNNNGGKRFLSVILVLVIAAAAALGISLLDPSGEFSFNLPSAGPQVIEEEYPSMANPNHQDFVASWDHIGRIFIGDSRFVGMNDVVNLMDVEEQFLVAETGKGYAWFAGEGLNTVNDIRVSYADSYDAWQYIICLGVNDLRDIDQYLALYYELAQDPVVEIVLVSVGPVSSGSVTNEDISAFNARLAESGFHYIDTYTMLMNEGFYAGDGLHYDNDTYVRIYNYILDNL